MTGRFMPDTDRLARYLLRFAVVTLCFGLGYLARELQWFPYPTLKAAQAFVAGGFGDRDTGIWQKLQNDLHRIPYRHSQLVDERLDLDEFVELNIADANVFRGPHSRLLYRRAPNAGGAYLVHGVFDLHGGLHASLLIGADGRLLRSWPVSTDPSDRRSAWLRNSQGLALTPEGDLISIAAPYVRSVGFCGQPRFRRGGPFHHVVSLAAGDTFWTLETGTPVRLDRATGENVARLDLLGLLHANPEYFGLETHALDWQLQDLPRGDQAGQLSRYFRPDPFHINDVEPLPEHLQEAFPGFLAGDLLLSFRTLNLLLIVRPGEDRVLWQAQGAFSGQHDPDWNADGSISFFDNRERRPFSDIRSLRPVPGQQAALGTDLVLAGERYRLQSQRWGTHQRQADGSVLVVAPQQGRLLHVEPDGSVRFELINLLQVPGEALRTLRFYEAIYLDSTRLGSLEETCQAS